VVASQELADARTVPVGTKKVAIEYNPTRPPQRLRFSLAHEIAHTLFPDVAKAARYRSNPASGPADAWQLELLCNIAAGELIMPTDSVPELRDRPLKIEQLMALRAKYAVSTEALLRRAMKVTADPAAMFAAARADPTEAVSAFRIDYTVPSRAWTPPSLRGHHRPADSVLAECTAVGYTAKRREEWSAQVGEMLVQAVGAPPFPGQRFPRVLGLMSPARGHAARESDLVLVHGDATNPRGPRPWLIVHLVNDRTANWGGAFARCLRERYQLAQDDFRDWARQGSGRLRLGSTFFSEVDDDLFVASMVAQRGYGRPDKPRIRYAALKQCLHAVAEHAKANDATVHMPRIGAGQAGGRWSLIRELVEDALTRQGVRVIVYAPPGTPFEDEPESQQALTLGI
jgi:O-acetyl-ADP-ribose deacetylase (regulator of RNase III)